MVHVLIIAMAVGIFLHDTHPPMRVLPPALLALVVLGPLLGIMLLAAFACRRTRARLNPATVRRADRVLTLCRLVVLPWFAAQLAAGLLVAFRRAVGDLILVDELLVMLPALGVVAWTWWCYYPIDRRLREAALFGRIDRGEAVYPVWTRTQFMLAQLRHQVLLVLLPLALVLAWVETVKRLPMVEGDAAQTAATFAGAVVIFVLSPLLIRFVFDTTPLPPGEVRDRLTHLCRVHRVRVRQLLLWRTFGGVINAAVMGVAAPVRYVMLTDALLDAFPREEVEAVMAHELAHARLHHMPWLLGFALVAASVCDLVLAMLLRDTATWSVPLIVAVTLAGLAWVAAFGWASRRIERQADAFAAAHLAREKNQPVIDAASAETMIAALQRVADLNHLRPAQRSWRHGSIQSRQHALRRLVGQPLRRHVADRDARRVYFVTIALGLMLTVHYCFA